MSGKSHDVPEQFAAWATLEYITVHSDALSAELLDELKPWLDSEKVTIDAETVKFFQLFSMYPIGVNRIDWRGVRGHLTFDVLPMMTNETVTAAEKEEKLAACRNLLLSWFDKSAVHLQERVVWIGDNSNVSLHMTIESLLEFYPLLFAWPQHHYVLPLTGQWCLNYTLEGQLFFGKAEDAVARGPVKLE